MGEAPLPLQSMVAAALWSVLVPVVPTWLSLRAFEQLRDHFKAEGFAMKKLRPFYSMADRRRGLHRELLETRRVEAYVLDRVALDRLLVQRAVDDGWGGTLGWFWGACAITTIVLVVVYIQKGERRIPIQYALTYPEHAPSPAPAQKASAPMPRPAPPSAHDAARHGE